MARSYSLRSASDVNEYGSSRAGRVLQTIRRSMDLTNTIMRERRRNEEVLSLSYQDSNTIAGANEWENIRENALNLPYRYMRWVESQATSKKLVIKVDRDAGAGQKEGGPADSDTGMWLGIMLGRAAYEAGFQREAKALLNEVVPRGVSVISIGYHEEVISLADTREVGKDAQSVVVDAVGAGDVEAKDGQDHAAISEGLGNMLEDDAVRANMGRSGVEAMLERKSSHDDAELKRALDDTPRTGSRMIRHRAWMRKRRVGEDVGWAPWVYDTEDTELWWDRHVWTVAQVKESDLFTAEFKKIVKGYDARNTSEVMIGGQTASTESMGSDAREAMSEDILGDDEKMVEWFAVWYRQPNKRSGGVRRLVSPEMPEEFIHTDESNPFVDDKGYALIPGFYPFYDFAPILSSLTVPERTLGIPSMAVGMTQFEKIAEYNRLRHESALRHSLRLYQIHPNLKDKKKVLDALQNGEDGFAFVAQGIIDSDGKMSEAVRPIQFTGNSQEIDRQAAREEGDWVKVMGMPPAVLQGMGTAETATQDQQGIAAGERESGAFLACIEERMADVMSGIRGLIRGNYDDEDFIPMLGVEGAQVIKAWQTGSSDDGDDIDLTFGASAQAQETVEKKQLMEAISLIKGEVDVAMGLPLYDHAPLFEELFRRLDVGAPKPNDTVLKQLQQAVIALSGEVERLRDEAGEGEAESGGAKRTSPSGGPNPSEGEGPTQGNLQAGAMRGTV